MTGQVILALLGHWRRAPLQLFTLIAGLALATALWSGVQAINAEARASYDAAVDTLGQGQFAQLTSTDNQPISQETFVDLRRAGWRVSPIIRGVLNGVQLIGVEPLTAPGSLLLLDTSNAQDIAAQGRAIRAAPDVADQLRSLGEVIVDPAQAAGTAAADIGVAQAVLTRAGEIDALIVDPVQPLRQIPLLEVAPDLTLRPAPNGSDIARLTDSFHLNLTAFGLLSFVVGLFIVHGAIGLGFEQRRAMLRTLRALGIPLDRLILVMGVELLAIAVFAGVIGTALGYAIAAILLPDVAATLRGLYGADVTSSLQFRPIWLVSGLGIAVGGTALASASAMWRVSRMPILATAGPRAVAVSALGRVKLQALIAAAMIITAAILATRADSLVQGFTVLALLLLGSALALPVVLDLTLRGLQALARSVVAQWFWADARQQVPALSLALMALMLAMSANVGVSTMVSSFRLTFVGFLDQRLAADLYVAVDTRDQAAALVQVVEGRVDAILPVQSSEVNIGGLPTEVYGNRDHSTFRNNWVFIQKSAAPWDDVLGGTGILLNEQLARRADLWVGDTVGFDGAEFRVAGVYGDYGNPIGQAVISEARFADLFPQVQARRFGFRLDPSDVEALQDIIEAQTDIERSDMIDQAGIKAASLGVFDRTFTVTAALNVLTLSVAGFAILMSLLTLAAMRVPQLAPAWAMGMTRAQLGRLELWRACLLATLTGVCALPLGLALAWVLLAIVNVAAFGWRLPMYLFPLDYAVLGGLSICAAFLAALWPAIRLARTPPSKLLQVFSNER